MNKVKFLLFIIVSMTYSAGLCASEYYRVNVKRESSNLYSVKGQNIYIKTKYCHEYAYDDDAILQIDSKSGSTIGQLIFVKSNGSKCDVEAVIG